MDEGGQKILSITGWCRNGSTIVGNVLGEVPDVVHVGELHFLWKNAAGMGANTSCGCGSELGQCPLWSRVLPVGRPPGAEPEQWARTVVGRQHACVRTRHTWRVLREGITRADVREHALLMGQVYGAIAEETKAKLIVETNKLPGETAVLAQLPGVVPYYVHLVRDPRAVADSWSRPKDYCYVMSPAKSTLYWRGFNTAAQAIIRRYPERSMLLRYEDFIAEPGATVQALLRLCGMDTAANPVQDGAVDLHTNHTVTGNPDRFRTGRTEIRNRDDGWRARASVADRLTVLALSWPQFSRYGYRYRGTFRSAPRSSVGRQPQGAGQH